MALPFLGGDLLAIYLNDHLGASTAARELVRRAAGANEGTELGRFLGRLEREIEEDRDALLAIMARLDVTPDRLKVGAGWAAEKVGRLKLNGRVSGYSPLSRVVELEGLLLGVYGKRGLWRALLRHAASDTRLDPAELERLLARAERQLEGLEGHHAEATEAALLER